MYEKRVEKLFKIAPSFQKVGVSGFHPGLERMVDFCNLMGNPQNGFQTIHIAGTNGKGSVAHMLAGALSYCAKGEKIGIYTSPHLVDFRERMRIVTVGENGQVSCEMISKEEVVSFLDIYDSYIEQNQPSFFEITTAMAFDFFAKSGVKYGIIETGLGGRFDSTNVITPILSIITSIGYDHKYILGDTLEQIAYEKGGIIKKRIPVVIGSVSGNPLQVLKNIAIESESEFIQSSLPLYKGYASEFELDRMDLKSSVQVLNIAIVCAALNCLSPDYLNLVLENKEIIYNTARNTSFRGRWEVLSERPYVICDIGHNEQALEVSMKQLVELSKGRRLVMVLGMAGDKDIEGVSHLYPSEGLYIYTQAQGMRAKNADELRTIIDDSRKGRGASSESLSSIVCNSIVEAYDKLMSVVREDDVVFIGGSSFVVAEFLPIFDGNKNVTNV